jgi:ribosome-associated protein
MVISRTSTSPHREFQPAVEALEAHKAQDVVVLDVRGLCEATDYFVIATGTSDTHVRALAERVIEAMGKAGHRPRHVEGLTGGRWVLLDFVDIVVHVFHPTLRQFYQLERLWADAPAVSTGLSR